MTTDKSFLLLCVAVVVVFWILTSYNIYDSDYFLDRLVRNLPVPIPYDGKQLVSLTNVQDVATLLLSPLNNMNGALQQRYFNCGTDQIVSYNDLVYLCADMARVPRFNVKIEYFDPEVLGTKGSFPYREKDFFVVPDVAKQILHWPGAQCTLSDDLIWYFDQYKNKRNGITKNISLIKDWEIVVGCKTSVPEYVASIYEQYDPLILHT
jgi:nucleoside-diphosphate-sugar epimerase